MELVTVKTKFQIVIPQSIRVEDGKITFTPKSVVDRHVAEGLADLAAGRSHGPYETAAEAIAAVEKRVGGGES